MTFSPGADRPPRAPGRIQNDGRRAGAPAWDLAVGGRGWVPDKTRAIRIETHTADRVDREHWNPPSDYRYGQPRPSGRRANPTPRRRSRFAVRRHRSSSGNPERSSRSERVHRQWWSTISMDSRFRYCTWTRRSGKSERESRDGWIGGSRRREFLSRLMW